MSVAGPSLFIPVEGMFLYNLHIELKNPYVFWHLTLYKQCIFLHGKMEVIEALVTAGFFFFFFFFFFVVVYNTLCNATDTQ